ncbi:hypothetical protein [Kitasatospora sp. LaBMicrA B282]|uniref:hypothetical protein n=1 Tax=Kitasatospora sp. LaBMicrA B282 TaxID=3420949 RepID=UPI003D0A0F78
MRVLTFWLRPAFLLRAVNRFQKLVGFDRSMALSSNALTALVPLALLLASVMQRIGPGSLADRIVGHYRLTGGGAEAVTFLFTHPIGTDNGTSIVSVVFLLLSVLSFSRAAQRLFERTWELTALSVRNTKNGLWWILTLALFLFVVGWLHALLDSGRLELAATVCQAPVTGLFLLWSGRILSAWRVGWRELTPFAVIGGAATGVYGVGMAFYLPHLFSSYATRYGPIGAVFAMITALFGAMLVLVASSALGREVRVELDRINQGHRPPEDEVRREWAEFVGRLREGFQTVRRNRSSGGAKVP